MGSFSERDCVRGRGLSQLEPFGSFFDLHVVRGVRCCFDGGSLLGSFIIKTTVLIQLKLLM